MPKECWKEKSLRGHLVFLTPSALCKLMFTYTFRKRRRKEKQSRVGLGVKIGIRGKKNTFSKQLGILILTVNINKGNSLLFWLRRVLINPISKHDNLKMICEIVFIWKKTREMGSALHFFSSSQILPFKALHNYFPKY